MNFHSKVARWGTTVLCIVSLGSCHEVAKPKSFKTAKNAGDFFTALCSCIDNGKLSKGKTQLKDFVALMPPSTAQQSSSENGIVVKTTVFLGIDWQHPPSPQAPPGFDPPESLPSYPR